MSCPEPQGPAQGLTPCLTLYTTMAERGCAGSEGRGAKLTLQGLPGKGKAESTQRPPAHRSQGLRPGWPRQGGRLL